MKIAPVVEVKAKLSAYLDSCRDEGPVIITRNGKPIAILLTPHDEEDLERLAMAYSPQFQAILEKSRQSLKGGKGLEWDEFWAEAEKGSVAS